MEREICSRILRRVRPLLRLCKMKVLFENELIFLVETSQLILGTRVSLSISIYTIREVLHSQHFHNKSWVINFYWFKFEFSYEITFVTQQ